MTRARIHAGYLVIWPEAGDSGRRTFKTYTEAREFAAELEDSDVSPEAIEIDDYWV